MKAPLPVATALAAVATVAVALQNMKYPPLAPTISRPLNRALIKHRKQKPERLYRR
jgi:hypothetical protein